MPHENQIGLLESLPLKQGLKPKGEAVDLSVTVTFRVTSIKTRIETSADAAFPFVISLLESLPLKQGLKLSSHKTAPAYSQSFRVTSIKTRIETCQAFFPCVRVFVLLESLPLKQGLKQKSLAEPQ